nr:MAG TPA: hypothetical protein [Bacteriophage sp.]
MSYVKCILWFFLFMYSIGSINQVGSLLTTFWIIPQ